MTPLDQLLKRIDDHIAETGTTVTAFGIAVANNPALVPRLRTGQVMFKTINTVTDYLDKHDKKKKAA